LQRKADEALASAKTKAEDAVKKYGKGIIILKKNFFFLFA